MSTIINREELEVIITDVFDSRIENLKENFHTCGEELKVIIKNSFATAREDNKQTELRNASTSNVQNFEDEEEEENTSSSFLNGILIGTSSYILLMGLLRLISR